MKAILNLLLFIGFFTLTNAGVLDSSNFAQEDPVGGKASWYGDQFHGRKTASGRMYDMNQLTAAHKSLPFGTKVRITNKKTGKSVVVTVNDRGPYVKGRQFDLSRAAFSKIASTKNGVISIEYEIVS